MKRLHQRSLAGIAFAAVVLAAGCVKHETPAPASPASSAAPPAAYAPGPPPVAAGYDYYYYPDVEVYYYPVGGLYWWFDGGVWLSGPRPPPTIVLREANRVVVRLDTDRPWTRHEAVIREHPRRHDRD